MKHVVEWQMSGRIEFDSDETELAEIAQDFQDAVDEGFDPMGPKGEIVSFEVTHVDDQHVHSWVATWDPELGTRNPKKQRCYQCSGRRDLP